MRFGMPQPRFTNAPSGSSSAARCAICSRVKRGLVRWTTFRILSAGIASFGMPLPSIAESFRLYETMNEDRGCHDMFRRDSPYRDDFLDFGDSGGRGHGHEGIEVSRGQPIRQIAQLIGLLPFNERVV